MFRLFGRYLFSKVVYLKSGVGSNVDSNHFLLHVSEVKGKYHRVIVKDSHQTQMKL